MKRIVIEWLGNGEIAVRAEGYQAGACKAALKPIEDAMGGEVTESIKTEPFEELTQTKKQTQTRRQ